MRSLARLGACVALACAAALMLSACRAGGPDRSRLMSRVDDARWTETQLRVALYDFVVRFAGVVDVAAREIAASSDSRAVRARALEWRANAVTACQAAAFSDDPVVGFVDTWALIVQMHDLFETARIREALGPAHAIGLEATARLEAQIEAIALKAGSEEGLERARGLVADFAAQHPIEDLEFTRASASQQLSQMTEQARRGVLATVETLEGRIADLTARLTIYAAHMPRQARWEAEVFTEHLLDLPEMARLVALPQEVPSLVAEERRVVLETLRAEREALLADVERQRLDTLAFVRGEREAVLAALSVEREAVVAALTDERRVVLDDIERQLADTLAMIRDERLETLAWAVEQREALLTDAARETNSTADRVLRRAFFYGLAFVTPPTLLLCLALLIGRGRVSLDLTKRD